MTGSSAAMSSPVAVSPMRPGRTRVSKAEHRRLRRRNDIARVAIAFAFLLPNLIFLTVFLILPLIQVFIEMFQTGGLIEPIRFVGFRNWERLLRDPVVVTTLGNTLHYAVIIVPTMLVLGLLIALVLQNVTRGGATLRALIYLPVLALNSVAAMEIWRSVGFWALYFLAALIGMPRELYQAAHLDGANAVQRFRFITLPLMRRVFLFAIVLSTIFVLQIFDSVYVMTDGGPANTTTSFVWYIYHALFFFYRTGFGATMAVLLLLVILALSLIQMRLLRKRTGV